MWLRKLPASFSTCCWSGRGASPTATYMSRQIQGLLSTDEKHAMEGDEPPKIQTGGFRLSATSVLRDSSKRRHRPKDLEAP